MKGIITNRKVIIIIATCMMVLCTLITAIPVFGAGQTIYLAGSTTVQPIAESSATPYYNYKGNYLNVSAGGSGAGASSILADTSDIGMLSCELIDKMTQAQVDECIDWKIARDMVCMVVHEDLGITDITKNEIKAIYEAGTGITSLNWNEVRTTPNQGSPAYTADELVVPVSRETSSGTRSTFMELVPITATPEETTAGQVDSTYTIVRQASNGDVAELVNSDDQFALGRGLIGYVGLGYALDTVNYPNLQILAIWNGSAWIDPSEATFTSYPLHRYLHMATRLAQYDPTYRLYVLDYVYYILGSEGQQLVEDEKFMPIVPGAEGNPAPYWDVNLGSDQKCNIMDAVKIGLKWQYVCAYKGEVPEDVDGNGKVNILDAAAVGLNWQKTWNW